LLRIEIGDLGALADLDISVLGFTDFELSYLLPDDNDSENDEAGKDAGEDVDPDNMQIDYQCPSCHYEWSGSAR
jgi:hypothetical protein